MRRLPKWVQALGDTRDGVFVIDGRQRIVLWNKGAERLLGYSELEVLNKHCYQIIAGRRCNKAWCHANCGVQRQILRGALPHDYDLLTRTKQGRDIWVNVGIVAVRRGKGRLTAHILRDITRQKQAAQKTDEVALSVEAFPAVERRKGERRGALRTPLYANELFFTLTRREVEVLSLLARGFSSKAIAHRLGVSRYTVRYHIKNALRKLGLHSRTAAVSFAFKNSLL